MQDHGMTALVEAIDHYLGRLDAPGAAAGIAEIRSRIGEAMGRVPQPVASNRHLPVLEAWLDPALAAVARQGEPDLSMAIAAAADLLEWVTYDAYDREKIGPHFVEGHAFATIIGDGGVLPAEDFCLGLFLIAPHVLYRDHHHPAPELYAPLTGPHGWRFNPGDAFDWRPAHRPVWNEANRPHAMTTGPEPFLCLFGWTRDIDLPALTIPSDDWAEIDLALQARKAAA